jgi:hypothetical protein
MTFNISPGVSFSEFDLTQTVQGSGPLPAAGSGIMRWGPMNQRVLLGSQGDLLNSFFQPSNLNGETWFNAWSYLAYGSQLWWVRSGDTGGNTIQVSYADNTGQSFTSGNNVVLLDNTSGLSVGMKLFYSNTTAISNTQEGGVYITSVNSSSTTLTSAPSANANTAQLIFRNNVFYTAVGQQNVEYDLQWAEYNVLNANSYNNIAGTFDPSICYVARYPGLLGNSLRVSVCDTPGSFQSNTTLVANALINATATFITANVGSNNLVVTVASANATSAPSAAAANLVAALAQESLSVGDLIQVGNSQIGYQFMQVTNTGTVTNAVSGNVYSFTVACQNPYTLIVNSQSNTLNRYWQYYNLLGTAPGQSAYVYNFGNTSANDQLHVVVVDQLGDFTGAPGAVLEVYKNLSRAKDAENPNGTTNYYANVINQQSRFVWWTNDRTTAPSANAAQVASSTATDPLVMNFQAGDDGLGEANVSMGTIANGFSYFSSPTQVSITSLLTGKNLGLPINGNTGLSSYLMNNISTIRRDCVVFASPDIASVVNNAGNEANAIITARTSMPSTSFGFLDSGYKYVYDQFNNVYRWCPLNGDMAGIESATQAQYGPWWSPGGLTRGIVKNVVQLAWNPTEPQRDLLYPNGINPVITMQGQGTVLWGDKTLYAQNSAFNRINVRELFIYIEQAILQASNAFLFDFNDAFTRAQFVSMVQPFLQQVQAQRGIIGYYVRCDATNNTAQVIQNNQFVCDIFIMPNYSINWIQLNFINVPPSMTFAEAETIQY